MCYARAREAFGKPLADQPLMQRKLAELIVEVEAAQALVFDGYDPAHRLRIGAPLIKLRAARLGITAASDAIEVHGGNGYVENWPVARILRDAQVNTLWEGPDNILCLDVRRGIEREQADVAFLDRLRGRVDAGAGGRRDHRARRASGSTTSRTAIDRWKALDRTDGRGAAVPARPVHGRRVRRRAAARAGRVRAARGLGSRKALVARLYADATSPTTVRCAASTGPPRISTASRTSRAGPWTSDRPWRDRADVFW